MISPSPSRIEDILNAPTQYAIPSYQRDFKWGESEARELVEDLDSYSTEQSEQLFLGNFILERSQGRITHIIDGQQRLTSVMLLLIACRMRARSLGLDRLENQIQSKLTFIDAATARDLGCRFLASDSIKDVFEWMANRDWDGSLPTQLGRKHVRRQVKRLRPLWEYFRSHTATMSEEALSQFLRALYNAYVIRIEISSDEEALHIFERTNARGMDLEVADLLKNFLFAQRVEGIEERWKDILANADGTILRMLKYYYVARAGLVKKPQLYRKLKAHGQEVGAEVMTAALAEFSGFYALAKAPTKDATRDYFESLSLEPVSRRQDRYEAIAASLQALQEFGITQFVPLAYSAIQLTRRSTAGAPESRGKAITRLFGLLEKYHFVNNVVCERVGNEVERLYADTCKEWASSNDLDLQRALDVFAGQLTGRRARYDEFRPRFADLSYSPGNVAIICYVFDRLNNHGVDPAQRLQIYVPSTIQLRRNNNIEHFLPRTLPEGIDVDSATEDSIDSIGNLLPLYFRTNSRLGNLPPSEKVSRLRGALRNEIQNLPFVQRFLDTYGDRASQWDAAAIQARGEAMAKEAYEVVWALR